MTLQQLEYIVAIDQQRNFSRAAEQCHVTQATLSAMVKKLEEEISLVIFDRKKQPVVVTEAGKPIIDQARVVLREMSLLQDLTQLDDQALSGTVRIGVIPTVSNALLPLVLQPILTTYPDLALELEERTTDEIIRLLHSDQLDMGILATPLNDSSLEEEIMYYEAMLVYGVTDPEKEFVLPKDLSERSVWLLEEGHCFRNQTMTICDIQEKAGPNNVRFEGNSFDTLLALTDQFGGYTLVPELYAKQMTPDRLQKVRPFRKPLPVREVSIVYHRPYARRKTIDALASCIRDIVQPKLLASTYPAKHLDIIGI